eukprot:CAMPEP_0116144450 /NCGR_PEP_ID=MMETSP0329-20121206/16012_1 /TAXON_ID=697910 /ORGANISM="Pseudo-nitzschia arenysensis, Strain B593" /LENGTH=185 /DNA_ID=CAMNT_0003639881 /DNA_START=66 /DNA_END=623 /DNA_ORIENTATION=+
MAELTTSYAEQQDDDPTFNPNRKSKLFFGLCDMRTAVVALDLINIVFTVIVAIILTTMYALDSGPYKSSAISSVLLSSAFVTVTSMVGLYSSMNWRFDGMIGTCVAFSLVLVLRIWHMDFIDVIVTAVLLYPHVVLTMEMHSGVMSPETFDDEEFVAEGGRDFVEMAHTYISPANTAVNTAMASP